MLYRAWDGVRTALNAIPGGVQRVECSGRCSKPPHKRTRVVACTKVDHAIRRHVGLGAAAALVGLRVPALSTRRLVRAPVPRWACNRVSEIQLAVASDPNPEGAHVAFAVLTRQ